MCSSDLHVEKHHSPRPVRGIDSGKARNVGIGAVAPVPVENVSMDLLPIHDFADTAAAISNLDLLITIDTAAAHVGGAIGARVWTMLPFASDYRWMHGRDDSIWYPTMKLFRQNRRNDWSDVVLCIREKLQSNG